MAVIRRADRFSPIQKQPVFYQDLSSGFKVHPNTLDAVVDTNIDAIKNSIRNILLTSKGERIFNPNFGSTINQFLFENFDSITKSNIKAAVEDALSNFEPRANVLRVDVNYLIDDSAVQISVVFNTINNSTPTTVDMLLYRVR